MDTSCSGCRALGRLKRLWESRSNPSEDSIGLSSLRNCAGELADLFEKVPSSASTGPPTGGKPPVTGEGCPAVPGKEKKTKEKEAGGRKATPPREVKEEPREAPEGPVKDLLVAEEESEESSEVAEDETVPVEAKRSSVELTERERAKRYREDKASVAGGPLGLRALPVRLSAPTRDGEGKEAYQTSRSRHSEPPRSASGRPHAERRENPGGDTTALPRGGRDLRARSPDYPPPRREERQREGRDRSRTPREGKKKKKKSKGSKGIRKRERGKVWLEEQRSAPQEKQWRRRY